MEKNRGIIVEGGKDNTVGLSEAWQPLHLLPKSRQVGFEAREGVEATHQAQTGNRTGLTATMEAVETAHSNPLITLTEQKDHAKNISVFAYGIAQPKSIQALLYRLELRAWQIKDWISFQWRREVEAGSLFNFSPGLLSCGIIAWYVAPSEPSQSVLWGTAFLFIGLLYWMKSRNRTYRVLMALFLFVLGMSLAALEISRKGFVVPQSGMTAQISGMVVKTERNYAGRIRYLIRPTRIEGLRQQELPPFVRATASKNAERIKVGEAITGLARLTPLTGPLYPGGYDFAYYAWLDGLGLTGFFMGKPKLGNLEDISSAGLGEGFEIAINRLRTSIADRITRVLPDESGAVAIALVTGSRLSMSRQTQESLRLSGLAHVLAISGLHMALVTLTIIGSLRLIFAVFPNVCERYPVRKWAICSGLVAATGYLFLSGASIATQRAWIMLVVMMVASLMDRRAITIRSVAVAALLILLWSPSSLFSPGFQMSFAAVIALVAAYGGWTSWRERLHRMEIRQQRGWLYRLGAYFLALAATSVIAGAATGFIAAWHFHRIAPLGLISNLLAMPVITLVVMPLCLLSVLLMPYGFEALTLKPAGVGIELVRSISDYVNGLSGGFETGSLPVISIILFAVFLSLVCCFKTPLRWFGLAFVVPLVFLVYDEREPPDLLVSQDGRAIAVKLPIKVESQATGAAELNGAFAMGLVNRRSGKFSTDIWQRAFLPNQNFEEIKPGDHCDRDLCHFELKGKKIWLVYAPKYLSEACQEADIVLAPRLWFVDCQASIPQVVISRTSLERAGSHFVRIEAGVIKTTTVWPDPTGINKGERQFSWQKRFDNVSRRFERW